MKVIFACLGRLFVHRVYRDVTAFCPRPRDRFYWGKRRGGIWPGNEIQEETRRDIDAIHYSREGLTCDMARLGGLWIQGKLIVAFTELENRGKRFVMLRVCRYNWEVLKQGNDRNSEGTRDGNTAELGGRSR